MRSLNAPWWLALSIVATLTVRAAVLASDPGSLEVDIDSYIRLAINWAESGVYGLEVPAERLAGDAMQVDGAKNSAALTSRGVHYERLNVRPTAYRPPLYPWLLSWLVEGGRLNTLGVAATHVVLGLSTAILVYFIALHLQIAWPFLPAMAFACDPILLRASQLPMTETLITFLAVSVWGLSLWLLRHQERAPRLPRHGSGIGARSWLGALLALSVLTRPTMLPWAICIALLFALVDMRSWHRIIRSAATGLVLLAMTAPWAMRNARELGQPVWTTTHGGYTLLLANNPSIYEHFKHSGAGRDWDANDFHRRWAERGQGDPSEQSFWNGTLRDDPRVALPFDEVADDRLAQRAALATIKREPLLFVRSCFIRVGWLWAPYPNDGSLLLKLAVGVWYLCFYCAALIGAVRIWVIMSGPAKPGYGWSWHVWLVPATLLITLTGIHAIYWSNMRMRAPLMPIVYVVGAIALTGQLQKLPPPQK